MITIYQTVWDACMAAQNNAKIHECKTFSCCYLGDNIIGWSIKSPRKIFGFHYDSVNQPYTLVVPRLFLEKYKWTQFEVEELMIRYSTTIGGIEIANLINDNINIPFENIIDQQIRLNRLKAFW